MISPVRSVSPGTTRAFCFSGPARSHRRCRPIANFTVACPLRSRRTFLFRHARSCCTLCWRPTQTAAPAAPTFGCPNSRNNCAAEGAPGSERSVNLSARVGFAWSANLPPRAAGVHGFSAFSFCVHRPVLNSAAGVSGSNSSFPTVRSVRHRNSPRIFPDVINHARLSRKLFFCSD